jgi:rhodanese-related sulfurtransferase
VGSKPTAFTNEINNLHQASRSYTTQDGCRALANAYAASAGDVVLCYPASSEKSECVINMAISVDRLLEEARAMLPHRPSPWETFNAMQSGVMVIDIRGDEQQRRDGLIPGALTIRRNVLEWRCDPNSPWHHERINDHRLKIVLVCDEGYQSSLAAANLQRLGLMEATDMEGGFVSWKQMGLPVAPYDAETVKGRTRPLLVLAKYLQRQWRKQIGRV